MDLFKRPSHREVEDVHRMLKPWEWLTSPTFFGLEHIPMEGPVLFVGNHSLLGMLDTPLMWMKLYHEKGIFMRPLGDHFHFKVPIWRDILTKFGMVDGNRENCTALMEHAEYILVFPGGAREAFKHKNEKYKLTWQERLGFARMAIQHQCPIVPFAAVGAEDCWDVIADGDDLMNSPFGKYFHKWGLRSDLIVPMVKGIGFTPIPRPQRLYFKFGKPIDTSIYKGNYENIRYCKNLREQVKDIVEADIQWLIDYRQQDPDRALIPRLWHQFTHPQQRHSEEIGRDSEQTTLNEEIR